jgi:hypothetical protein
MRAKRHKKNESFLFYRTHRMKEPFLNSHRSLYSHPRPILMCEPFFRSMPLCWFHPILWNFLLSISQAFSRRMRAYRENFSTTNFFLGFFAKVCFPLENFQLSVFDYIKILCAWIDSFAHHFTISEYFQFCLIDSL